MLIIFKVNVLSKMCVILIFQCLQNHLFESKFDGYLAKKNTRILTLFLHYTIFCVNEIMSDTLST